MEQKYKELKNKCNKLEKKLDAANNNLQLEIIMRKALEEKIGSLSARYEAILAAIPDIIMEVDNNKIYTWGNKAGIEFFGNDVIGKEAADYFEGEQNTYNTIQPILNGNDDIIYVESWQRRKDGSKRLLAWWCRVLKDNQGNVQGALSTARDITEQKKVEEALRNAYDVINKSPVVAFLWKNKEAWPVELVTDNVKELFGYSAEEFISGTISYSETIHPDDLERVSREVELNSKYIDIINFTHEPYRIITKNETIKWIEDKTFIRRDASDSITHYQGVVFDITEQKHFEIALQEAHDTLEKRVEERTAELNKINQELHHQIKVIKEAEEKIAMLHAAVEQSIDGIAISSFDKKIIFVNKAFAEMHGYLQEEMIGMDISQLHSEEQLADLTHAMQQILDHGYWIGEIGHKKKNGLEFQTFMTTNVIKDHNGKELGLLAVIRDITQMKKDEAKLRFLSSIATQSSEGMAVSDLEGYLLFVNKAWATMHGFEDSKNLIGQSLSIFHSKEQLEREVIDFNRVVIEKGYNSGEQGHIRGNTPFQTLMNVTLLKNDKGIPFALAAVAKDITDLKKMEHERIMLINELQKKNEELERSSYELKEATEQIVQSGKMAALGELTAGIAHELSQPLNGIKIITQSLTMDIKQNRLNEEKLNEKLHIIIDLINKMSEILQHMRIFTRKTYGSAYKETDINEVIKNSFNFVEQQLINNNIQIKKEFCNETLIIYADPIQLEQVLLNLLSNSRYALLKSEKNLKELIIKAAKEEDNAVISVIDNGIGISDAIKNKIFDPFFTTKNPGEGTGLGLSVSKKIINEHKGMLDLNAKPDYTEFKIILPLHKG